MSTPIYDEAGRIATYEAAGRPRKPAQSSAPEARYFIRKGGYYYRPNAQGYTVSKEDAGRYTLEEAIAYSHPNGPDGPRDGISYEPAPYEYAEELRPTMDAYMRACRALNWRTAELRANGIEPCAIPEDAPHYPPDGHVFNTRTNAHLKGEADGVPSGKEAV